MRRALSLLALLTAAAACRGDLDSPDPARRAAAVRARAPRSRDGDVSALLVAARDPSPEVRCVAAELFARLGGPAAAEAVGALLRDPAPSVVAAAARGLATMPNEPRARADLLAAFAAADPEGRRAIAEALEALGVSLREAVELEARALWERNLAALAGDAGAKPGAAEEIGASARAEAVQRLVPLVDPGRKRDAALAAGAARGLGEAGDWVARPHLEALLTADDARLAEAAADALGRLGDPAAADVLANAAATGPGRTATAAIQALAALPAAPDVASALCAVALKASDPGIAAAAARAASARDAACPDKALLQRLGKPGTEAALSALAELPLAPATAQAAAERAAQLLDPARTDAATRAAAARLLAHAGGPRAAAAVLKRLATLAPRLADAARPVTPAAAPPGAAAAPVRAAKATAAPDPARDAAELGALLAAAGRLRADGAEPLLLAAAKDPSAPVRAGAVEGLASLASRTAVDVIEAALADPEVRVRVVAAEALGHQGARGSEALARAAAGAFDEPEWRAALARALGDAGEASSVPVLAQLLEGPAAPAAAAALGRLATPAAATPLAAHLERPDAAARPDTIDALAQLGVRETAPVVAAQLMYDRPEVRAAAARALGRMRYEQASGRLEALRSDYYGRVRRAAIEALSRLPTGAPRGRP